MPELNQNSEDEKKSGMCKTELKEMSMRPTPKPRKNVPNFPHIQGMNYVAMYVCSYIVILYMNFILCILQSVHVAIIVITKVCNYIRS